MKLSTSYMGLSLKSPILVSSSGLTSSVEKIKQLAENGAGAVVLKSLFEEQIQHEVGHMLANNDYPEAEDYLANYVKSNTVEEYIKLISGAKKAVDIPIIASINCVTNNDWTSFAKDIEQAGADALELNIHIIPTSMDGAFGEYEEKYFEILRTVKSQVTIPISVKIGMQFTNLPKFVDLLAANGASAVVLFNRFYEMDIDTATNQFGASAVFSTPDSMRHSLRWMGIISDRVKRLELSASTGVHDGNAVVKQLLAGAQAVHVCSVLYQRGVGELKKITAELEAWMDKNGHETIGSFRGSMNYSTINDASIYERAQFMKYFSNVE